MKKMKLLIVLLITILLTACGEKEEVKNDAYDLWVVTAAGDMGDIVGDFNKLYPNIKVKLQIIPYNNYSQMAVPLMSEKVTPDIMTITNASLGRFKNKGLFEAISKVEGINYNPNEYYDYLKNLVVNKKGETIGVMHQSTPGAYFYRASIMKKIIGTDNPEEVSKYTTSVKGFKELGEKAKGKGVYLLGNAGEIFLKILLNSQVDPFVDENNKLNLNGVKEAIELGKELMEKEYAQPVKFSSPQYFASMNSNNVLGFMYPTWGVVPITRTAKESFGDWRVAEPPYKSFMGGFMTTILKTAKNKENAEKFINFMISEKYLTKYAKEKGDFVSNIKANQENLDSEFELYGTQKVNRMFDRLAKISVMKKRSEYDSLILVTILEIADTYYNTDKYANINEVMREITYKIKSIEPAIKL